MKNLDNKIIYVSVQLGFLRAVFALFFVFVSYLLLTQRITVSETLFFLLSIILSFLPLRKRISTVINTNNSTALAAFISVISYAFFSLIGLFLYGASFKSLVDFANQPLSLVSNFFIQYAIFLGCFIFLRLYSKK